MKKSNFLTLPYVEAMNVLNRAQELCVLSHESNEERLQECLRELNTAMNKLGKTCPDLDVNADASELRVAPTKPGFGDVCADDFEDGSDNYYEQTAIDCYGSAIRDNTRAQRIAIGKRIEENGFEF